MGRLINVEDFKNEIVKYSHQSLKTIGEALDKTPTVDAIPVSYIRKWIENHPTDYTTVESMLTDWREEGEQDDQHSDVLASD